MPRTKAPSPQYVLVEGKNDLHVIKHLCERHGLPETFGVEVPEGEGGIEALLAGLTTRLRAADLQALGIVVDADTNPTARWQALRDQLRDQDKLQSRVYTNIPAAPPASGWISAEPDLPRVGIWLMPDNQGPGVLEDFALRLIPASDRLLPKAEAVLQEIERDRLQHYRSVYRPKALIHTWLAWQETPGQPLGTAIAARSLHHDTPSAHALVAWLRRLFDV